MDRAEEIKKFIKQPVEGLLYDLDLMPEQCKTPINTLRYEVIECQYKENERLTLALEEMLKVDTKVIEELRKEKEAFRKDNCKVNEERAHVQGRNMVLKEEKDQLEKEREWLIKQAAKTLNGLDDTYSEIYYRNYIKREMEQALKRE